MKIVVENELLENVGGTRSWIYCADIRDDSHDYLFIYFLFGEGGGNGLINVINRNRLMREVSFKKSILLLIFSIRRENFSGTYNWIWYFR